MRWRWSFWIWFDLIFCMILPIKRQARLTSSTASDLNSAFAILTNNSLLIFFFSSADDNANSSYKSETRSNSILWQNFVLYKYRILSSLFRYKLSVSSKSVKYRLKFGIVSSKSDIHKLVLLMLILIRWSRYFSDLISKILE